MERINKRQEEKAELEAQLALENKKDRIISAQEVTHFLSILQKSNFNDSLNRRAVINIFLNKIYLYDDKFRLILNGSGQAVEIDDIMLDEMDDYFDSQSSDLAECSSVVADAPPRRSKLYIACSDFLQKSERAHAAAPPFQIEPAPLGFDLVLGADLRTAASIALRCYILRKNTAH